MLTVSYCSYGKLIIFSLHFLDVSTDFSQDSEFKNQISSSNARKKCPDEVASQRCDLLPAQRPVPCEDPWLDTEGSEVTRWTRRGRQFRESIHSTEQVLHRVGQGPGAPCECPAATITNYHKPGRGWLKTAEMCSLSVLGPSSLKSRGWQGRAPCEDTRGESYLQSVL